MKWNARVSNKKISEQKPEPRLGDKKEKIRFAIFPTKIEDKWVWLEKYIGIYEYKKSFYTHEETVHSGIIFDTVGSYTVVKEEWVCIDKQMMYQ